VESADDVRRRAEATNELHRPTTIANSTVVRPAGPASATVHSLLRHLRSAGVTSVPEPLALDERTEILSYLPGDSGGDAWRHQHDDAGMRSAARLLREVHDAAADWRPPHDAVFAAPAVDGDERLWCHGDPGPWNFVWQDGRAVGLIDWDYLHLAPRVDDVAYALFWFAPMRSDAACLDWHHFPRVPDRRARISEFLDAYGDLPAFDVVDAVVRRRTATVDHMRSLARDGVEPQRTWVADGLDDADLAEVRWLEQHCALLTP
jgi:aminoglycoside phosphotransferase (APT) family kinase protein